MIKNLKGKKKGFSLVELIVVIAIIGILAAIAVPKYSTYKKNANKKADIATAKVIADSTVAYILEKDIRGEFEFVTPVVADTEDDDQKKGNEIIKTLVKDPDVKSIAGGHFIVAVDTEGEVTVSAKGPEDDSVVETLYPN